MHMNGTLAHDSLFRSCTSMQCTDRTLHVSANDNDNAGDNLNMVCLHPSISSWQHDILEDEAMRAWMVTAWACMMMKQFLYVPKVLTLAALSRSSSSLAAPSSSRSESLSSASPAPSCNAASSWRRCMLKRAGRLAAYLSAMNVS